MSNPKNIVELYSGFDLATLFKGNFINFGFWKEVPKVIAEEDVVEANRNLYRQVFQRLLLKKEDNVLELGSGHGGGCSLLADSYSPQSVVGLDYLTAHVEHAYVSHALLVKSKKIQFLQGKAESIPLPDASISKIYTVEAFQHFDAQCAVPEFARVLTAGGKLVITTFFAKNKNCFAELLTLLPRSAILPDDNNGYWSALPEVLCLLESSSFRNVHVENISSSVWLGYDVWVKQNDPSIWDTNWRVAYEKGLVDYHIITADAKK